MSENGEIYTTGKKFTLPPAVTAWTNSTSVTKSLGHSRFRHSEYSSILRVLEDVIHPQPADMCKGGKAISMARRLPVGSPN